MRMAIFNIIKGEVERIDISNASITTNSTLVYNGSAQKPYWTVRYNGQTLTEGVDYITNNVTGIDAAASAHDRYNLITYTETFTGIGSFTGTTSKSFNIQRRQNNNLDLGTIVWTGFPTEIQESDSGTWSRVTCTITAADRFFDDSINYRTLLSNSIDVDANHWTYGSTQSYVDYIIYLDPSSATSASWVGYFYAKVLSKNEYRTISSQNITLTYP